jgi:hypothetical protein
LDRDEPLVWVPAVPAGLPSPPLVFVQQSLVARTS